MDNVQTEQATIRPSGHLAIPARTFAIGRVPLVDVCKEWLDDISSPGFRSSQRMYLSAIRMLSDMKILKEEMHTPLLEAKIRAHERYEEIHHFINAVHYTVWPKVIVYDLDTPEIDRIASKYGGLFVNTGTLGDIIGKKSSGVIVNLNKVGNSFAEHSSAAINCGTMGDYCVQMVSQYLVHTGNCGKEFPRVFPTEAQVMLSRSPELRIYSEQEVIPVSQRMREFLEQLKADGASPVEFERIYRGPEEIKATLEKIFREAKAGERP